MATTNESIAQVSDERARGDPSPGTKGGKKKKKQKSKNKQLYLDNFTDAMKFIQKNTKKIKVSIHPTMIPLLAPTTMSADDNNQVQYNLPHCNHNQPNRYKVCEIMNNMINNIMGVKNHHDRSLGADGELLAIKWNKVSYSQTWKNY